MNRPLILSIGEILWDMLPSGKQLGGAPANLAYHAHCLGADATTVSGVGDDALGQEILDRVSSFGLSSKHISIDATHPTGVVTVALSASGQPSYTIEENVAWDCIKATDATLEMARRADAIAFGSLAQRAPASRQAITAVVSAAPDGALKIFDINLRPPFVDAAIIESSLLLANALKLNDEELPILAKQFDLGEVHGDADERRVVAALADKFKLQLVALTRGSRGSLLLAGSEWSEYVGEPVKVADTVGAGDSFTAALICGWLAKRPLAEIQRAATKLASHVCTQSGATPLLPAELRDEILGTASSKVAHSLSA